MAAGGQVPGPRTESIQDSHLLSHMLLTEKKAEFLTGARSTTAILVPPPLCPSPLGSQSRPPPVSSNLVFKPNVPYKYFHFLCDL